MSEYLSKEEIKQWRSSLEKITLEEYAARLGKKLEQEKHTNDIVDIALKGQPIVDSNWSVTRSERISSIAERAFERENEIAPSVFKKPILETIEKSAVKSKPVLKPTTKSAAKSVEKTVEKSDAKTCIKSVNVVFKKALTDREQRVFEYFSKNCNKIVYAKDLATLLELPRDYVYKYIKNLRAKIEGDSLVNADQGGFILKV